MGPPQPHDLAGASSSTPAPAAEGDRSRVRTRTAAETRGARRTVVVIALAGLVVGVVGLLLAGLLGGDDDGVSYADLEAGDCFVGTGALRETASVGVSRVDLVDCDRSHLVEVYGSVVHPAPPEEAFPGMDALVLYASVPCQQQFNQYSGVPFASVNLLDVYVTPQASAWDSGSRLIICGVSDPDGEPTEGSVRRR